MALRFSLLVALAWLCSVLSGCALPRQIDSEVQSFAGQTALVLPATFRFERLPSQHNNPLYTTLERETQAALARSGLERNDVDARYGATVTLAVETLRNPRQNIAHPHLIFGTPGVVSMQPYFIEIESRWFRHRLHLTLRDTRSGELVYETSATFDGPWGDSANLIGPMLEAALSHFPNPNRGSVTVELPTPGKEQD